MIIVQLKVHPEELSKEYEQELLDAANQGQLWVDCQGCASLKSMQSNWPEETYREVVV